MCTLVAAENYNGRLACERHGKMIIPCLRKVSRKTRFFVTIPRVIEYSELAPSNVSDRRSSIFADKYV